MATQWDNDRITGRIEARTDDGKPGQRLIGNGQGYVVRLYDHGPPDGRTADPRLIFDSESTYGSGGTFESEDAAAEYRDRRVRADLEGARQGEQLGEERRARLPKLGLECIAERLKAKAEAREANARAKAADERHDQLTKDAHHPLVFVECPPKGSGWTVQAAPCETEPPGPEPRVLAQVLPDEAKRPPKRKGRGKKKSKADPLPDAIEASFSTKHDDGKPDKVPDYCGIPFGVGATVRLAEEGTDPAEGEVLAITRPDTNGEWYVEVEFPDGPVEAYSIKFERIKDDDGEDHWGDEGPDQA